MERQDVGKVLTFPSSPVEYTVHTEVDMLWRQMMHLKESIYQHIRNGASILALFVVSSESYNSRYVGL